MSLFFVRSSFSMFSSTLVRSATSSDVRSLICRLESRSKSRSTVGSEMKSGSFSRCSLYQSLRSVNRSSVFPVMLLAVVSRSPMY